MESADSNAIQTLADVYHALDQKFGKDIVVMDISGISTITDYFIILTGGSAPQIQALAAAAEETLTKRGYKLLHTEGMRSANWVLMDFGDIIIHLFDKENRAFYNLERVWGDAGIVQVGPVQAHNK